MAPPVYSGHTADTEAPLRVPLCSTSKLGSRLAADASPPANGELPSKPLELGSSAPGSIEVPRR